MAVHGGSDGAAEDFGDDGGGLAGAVDLVIGELIGREALGEKRTETIDIAEERASGHGHAALEKNFDGRIEPDDGNARGAEKFGRAGLGVGAAAEGEDGAFFGFESAAEGGAKLVGLDLAEGGLAETFEDLRDGQAGGFLDAFIEIDEAPGQLASEQGADGGLAGAHKAGEAENLSARGKPARRESCSHE